MTAYYNELDPKAAAWIRELIRCGHVAPGEVDERSIVDVRGSDLAGFTQCHFFAGIGVWSHALRSAGWADERPVWTGSCPCQSFSAAGSGRGFDDERHLWPHFFRLIREQRPSTVFGEQVASKDGLAWLDFVCADMEGEGYAIAPLDLCAAGFGAPHIRQRLFFVADTERGAAERHGHPLGGTAAGVQGEARQQRIRNDSWDGELAGSMADPANAWGRGHAAGQDQPDRDQRERNQEKCVVEQSGATGGFWANAEWIYCRDGKHRAVEPGTFPLVNGAAARVGRLRGYGNAIVAPVAQEFIKAYMQARA